MEDKLLLETIERYLGGTMLAEEKAWFEQLRKNTLRLIRWLLSIEYFFTRSKEFGMVQKNQTYLHNTHKTLVEKADINEGGSVSTRGRVVQFYNKYKSYGYCSLYCRPHGFSDQWPCCLFSPAVNNDQIELLGKRLNRLQECSRHRVPG